MPISVTGIWKADFTETTRGFTLLEIMVVLALIGSITSFAVLSIGGGGIDERLQTEARRLAALIELNQHEAILLNQQRGLRFAPAGYVFLRYNDDNEWIAIEPGNGQGNNTFQHTLADTFEVKLVIEGRLLQLETDPALPQVLLLSSGETTEFSATFTSEYARGYSVIGDSFGQLSLAPVQ